MSNFLEQTKEFIVSKSDLHGDGVTAGHHFTEDEIILHEKPLLCLQSLPNRRDALVCRYCYRFIGTIAIQLDYLSKRIDRQSDFSNDYEDNVYTVLSPIVKCESNCGELYCSQSCRLNHFKEGHSLLCTGHIEEENAADHPLIKFKTHSIETNEIFLLVADIFAKICLTIENNNQSSISKDDLINKALEPYEGYVRQLWWDAAVAKDKDEPEGLRMTLQTLVKESWSLLSICLNLQERDLNEILSEEYMARTIGMFEQNNVGVRLANPVGEFILKLHKDSPEDEVQYFLTRTKDIVKLLEEDTCWEEDCEEVDVDDSDEDDDNDEVEDEDNQDEQDQLSEDITQLQLNEGDESKVADKETVKMSAYDELQQLIAEEGIEVLYPPLDGTAFYTNICKINHSCTPNVIVKYSCDTYEVEAHDICSNDTSTSNSMSDEQSTAGDHTMGVCVRGVRGLRADLTVLKEILPGEELVQSYIDQSLSYRKRSAALRDYGFKCSCPKCVQEEAVLATNSSSVHKKTGKSKSKATK
eukprot:gene1861-3608_t